MLPNFLQLCMWFALLKNYKIPIFNAAMAIETVVCVKQFMRNFPITLSKSSMFSFRIIKPISKIGFRLHFNRQRTFSRLHVKGALLILKVFWQIFIVKVIAVLIGSKTKHVFLPTWFTSSALVNFG